MSTAELLIFLAAVAQAAIMIYAIITLGVARVKCLQDGTVTMKDIALSDTPWPEEIKKLQNNAKNQYETPVLFFAAVAIALAIGAANWGVALFAWAFIASRIVHRVIHVGSNHVRKRFYAYVAGLLALCAMWIALLVGALI